MRACMLPNPPWLGWCAVVVAAVGPCLAGHAGAGGGGTAVHPGLSRQAEHDAGDGEAVVTPGLVVDAPGQRSAPQDGAQVPRVPPQSAGASRGTGCGVRSRGAAARSRGCSRQADGLRCRRPSTGRSRPRRSSRAPPAARRGHRWEGSGRCGGAGHGPGPGSAGPGDAHSPVPRPGS